MIISRNLSALKTSNKLVLNNDKRTKSIEKLSSGLRINRASDDAAGLSISEKMRAQIRGLDQATRNVQDGISLIQTADSGLQETTNMIQRQRELIIQGLNDTYTDEDRKMIDQEIKQLTEEINSLAKRTSFNTMNLLARDDYQILADRSRSNTTVTTSDPPSTTSMVKSVVYKPKGTPDEPRHLVSSKDSSATTYSHANTNTITPIVSPDGREGYNEYNVDIHTTTKTDTNTSVYETLKASTDAQYTTPAYWYTVGDHYTHFGPKDWGNVYGTLFENIEVNGVSNQLVYGSRTSPGTVPAAEYFVFAGTNLQITRYRTLLADNSMEVKYVITNSDSFDSTIKLSNMIDPPKNSVITDQAGNPLAVGSNVITPPSGSTFHMAGDEANASIEFDDALGFLAPTDLSINNPASGQPKINFDWQLTLTQGSSITVGFKYGPFSLNLDVFEQTTETEISQHIETSVKTDVKDIDYIPPTLHMQAGANANQSFYIPLFNTNADGLGLTNMGVLLPAVARESLEKADRALERLMNYRGIYGGLLNRMEHTMNNLGTSSENLVASESRIRDVDMAKEIMEFTKQNMLAQVSQSMLTQANQQSNSVLELLKS